MNEFVAGFLAELVKASAGTPVVKVFHGSPTGIKGALEPRVDPRTGEEGVFFTTSRESAHAYALLANRARSNIEHVTHGGKFISGKVETEGAVLPEGFIYEALLPEKALDRKASTRGFSSEHTRISRVPILPLGHSVITKADAKRLGWSFAEKKAELVLGMLSELMKVAAGTPDEVLVDGEHAKLTKSQVRDYYLHPKTRQRIIPQLSGRPVMLVQQHGEPVVRRKTPEGKEIMIEEGAKGPDDPSDYMNWVARHTVEFHPVHGQEVDHLFVDVDPKGAVPWEKTKEVTKGIAALLRQEPDVTGTRIVFSGGRGFHVKAKLTTPISTDKARSRLQRSLSRVTGQFPGLTLGVPGPSQIRLDVSTLHDKGSLRAEYSINRKTGLVAIPVTNLDAFTKEDARIENVIGRR